MIVPPEERFLGVETDTNSSVRVFRIPRYITNEIDLSSLAFFLDIRYEDNSTNETAFIDMLVSDNSIDLTWYITANDLGSEGAIFLQLKANDLSGKVKWKSYVEPFFVGDCINAAGQYTGDLSAYEALVTRCVIIENREVARMAAEELRQTNTTNAVNNANTAAQGAIAATSGAIIATDRANQAAEVVEGIVAEKIGLNDFVISLTEGWSSSKISSQLAETESPIYGGIVSKPLKKGILSFTFDNSYISTYTKVFPNFKNKGLKFAVSPVAESFASNQKDGAYYNYAHLKEMVDYGVEVIAHGMTGLNLTVAGVNLEQAKYEIQECKRYWNKLGFKINGYCGTNSEVYTDYKNYLKAYEYAFSEYWTELPISQSVINENTDIYSMGRHNLGMVYASGGVNAVKAEIDYIETNKVWLNYYNHQMDTGTGDSIPLSDLILILDYAKTKNIEILLPTEAINRLNTKLIAGENLAKIRKEMADSTLETKENIALNPRYTGVSAIPTGWGNRDTTVGGLTKTLLGYNGYNAIKYSFDTTNNTSKYVGLSQVVPISPLNKIDILTFSIEVDSDTTDCDLVISLNLQSVSEVSVSAYIKTIQLIKGKKEYECSLLVPKTGYAQLAYNFNFYPKAAVAMNIIHLKPKLEFGAKRTSWLPSIEEPVTPTASITFANSTDNNATPTVTGVKYLYLNNTASTTITNFITTESAQEITLFFGNGNTTIVGSGFIRLKDGQNFAGSSGDVLTLLKYDTLSTAWYEKYKTDRTV